MGSASVIAGMTSQTIENKMAPIIIIIIIKTAHLYHHNTQK